MSASAPGYTILLHHPHGVPGEDRRRYLLNACAEAQAASIRPDVTDAEVIYQGGVIAVYKEGLQV